MVLKLPGKCKIVSDLYRLQLNVNGNIIFRYRKFNPYTEDVAITKEPEIVSFRTDFNVTFGIIVCFDLILDEPANALLEQGIRNFVFSTMWHNQLPYGNGEC